MHCYFEYVILCFRFIQFVRDMEVRVHNAYNNYPLKVDVQHDESGFNHSNFQLRYILYVTVMI